MSFSTLVLFWRHTSKLSTSHSDTSTISTVSSAEVLASGTNVVQSHAHISHKPIEKDRYPQRQRGHRDQQPWLRPYFSLTSRARYLMLLRIILATAISILMETRLSLLETIEATYLCLRLRNFQSCSQKPKKRALPYRPVSRMKA